jgi:hypothetical protein
VITETLLQKCYKDGCQWADDVVLYGATAYEAGHDERHDAREIEAINRLLTGRYIKSMTAACEAVIFTTSDGAKHELVFDVSEVFDWRLERRAGPPA